MPIIVPYIASAEHSTVIKGLYLSVLFSTGRLISYLVLGILLGFAISSVSISPIVAAITTIVLGCLVVFHGLSVLRIFRPNSVINLNICKYLKSHKSPVYLGVVTGLRPCIPLITAITFSINLSGIAEVILFMLSLWVGSSVFIFLIGPIIGGLARVASAKISAQRVKTISGVALVVVGLFLIVQSLGLTGYYI
jgi:sulfite exporter TauE/SafE